MTNFYLSFFYHAYKMKKKGDFSLSWKILATPFLEIASHFIGILIILINGINLPRYSSSRSFVKLWFDRCADGVRADPNSKCGIGFFFPSTTFNRSSSSSLAKLFTSGGLGAANIDNRYCASFPRHRPRATLLPRCRGNYYGGLKTRLLLPATKGSPIFGNSFNNRRNNPICPVVENYSSSRRENEIGVSQSF